MTAVEVEADGADKTGSKEGLPDHDLALYLLGYNLINVGSVEEEDTNEVIPVFEDFDGDTVNGLGFVEVAVATNNEPGKIRAFTSAGDVKNSLTTKKLPQIVRRPKFPVEGILTWAAIRSVVIPV